MTLSRRDFLLVMLVVITWGLHAPIMKLGVEEIGPLLISAIRFILTGLLLLPFAKKISQDDFKKLIPVSILFVSGNLICANLALNHISSNSFILIIQIAQPFTLLCALFFFKEKFGLLTSTGIFISLIGLVIVFGAPDILASPIGAGLAIIAAISWSLGSLSMKKTGHIKPASFLCYTYLISAPIALIATLVFEDNHFEKIISADKSTLSFVLLYQVIVMAAMTFVWSGLMARNPAQYVTPFMMLQPVFAVIGSYYIFSEKLNESLFFGGAVILFGLSIIHIRKIQKASS